VPLGYAAGQVLAEAVEGAKTLDQVKLAQYMHTHSFNTVMGEISFGKDGEWTKARTVFEQYQHIKGHDLAEFKSAEHEVVVWPDNMKSGNLIYPYSAAQN